MHSRSDADRQHTLEWRLTRIMACQINAYRTVYSTAHWGLQQRNLNCLFRLRTYLQMSVILTPCDGKSIVNDTSPSQKNNNLEKVSMSWRHHAGGMRGYAASFSIYMFVMFILSHRSGFVWSDHMGLVSISDAIRNLWPRKTTNPRDWVLTCSYSFEIW